MFLLSLLVVGSRGEEIFPTYRQVVIENGSVGYSKIDSPYDVYHTPINLTISPSFVVLTNVVEAQQLVSYIFNVVFIWTDRRLRFSPDLLGTNLTVLPSNLIWLPTIDCFNCLDLHIMDKETDSNEVSIFPDGMVYLFLKARFDTVCEMDIEAFPFDTQYCGIDFYSGFSAYDGRLIFNAENITHPEILLGTPEWHISSDVNTRLKGGEESYIGIRFALQRNSSFYVLMLIIPTIIITSLCLAALTLPLDFTKGEKYTMGVSGLLGLTFLLSIIIGQVPRSSKMPILGQWLLVEMFFCLFATVLDEPVRYFKKKMFKRNLLSDQTIDLVVFAVIFGANLLTTILMFVVRSESKKNPHPIV